MPVKIRLQRHGKKGKPFYAIVAADARSKRDGKFLEKLGTYNPNTNPATIELNIEGAVKWLHNGAQPTDTARNLLSYKGVMLKHHLEIGVRKGAITEAQAEEKFNAWLTEKEAKIQAKKDGLSASEAAAKAEALAAEKAVNQKRIDEATAAEEALKAEAAEAEALAKAEAAAEEAVEEEAIEEKTDATAAPETTATEKEEAANEEAQEAPAEAATKTEEEAPKEEKKAE
jgi:small subunit ribosomal protein S16